MKRYEGLLRPLAKPAPWPIRWVIVDTVGHPVAVVNREGIRRTGLESWHAIILTMHGGEHACSEELAGDDAGSLWRLLGEVAGRAGPTWVISPRAIYSWTLLGVFERLLLGGLSIHNRNPVRPHIRTDRGLGREPGMFLAADPPSAAALLLPGSKNPVTWVCAGNYGWKGMSGLEAGLPACRQLAEGIVSSSRLLALHQLGGWAVTVGAMALRNWRATFMKECIYVSQREEYLRLVEGASFGGRCFVGQGIGRTAVGYRVDGRGLYCQLAITSPLPCGCRSYGSPGHSPYNPGRIDQQSTLARVHLRRAGGRFPFRIGGEVEYPLEGGWTTLVGPELSAAFKENLVTEVGEYCAFKIAHPIQTFEEACRAGRIAAEQSGSRFAAALFKSLAVALIGKTAARSEIWEEVKADYNDPIAGSWIGPDGRGGNTEYHAAGGIVSRRIRGGLAHYAIPEIALWLWSLGRCWLWERMAAAGVDQVLYADTDGLVVTERGYERLLDGDYVRPDTFGELRLLSGPVEVEVVGPKVLRIGDEIIQAGAPKGQRGTDFAAKGFWYRRPLDATNDAVHQRQFEEEYRERRSAR